MLSAGITLSINYKMCLQVIRIAMYNISNLALVLSEQQIGYILYYLPKVHNIFPTADFILRQR